MVRTKVTPHHAEVRPPKCTVYITHNPVTFVIQRHHELFRLDQLVREKKHLEAYKQHVHRPPTKPADTNTSKDTAHSGCDEITTIHHRRDSLL